MNNGGKHSISGLVIIVNHYVITKVGWNISMPHKLYIILIYNVLTINVITTPCGMDLLFQCCL